MGNPGVYSLEERRKLIWKGNIWPLSAVFIAEPAHYIVPGVTRIRRDLKSYSRRYRNDGRCHGMNLIAMAASVEAASCLIAGTAR